MKSDMFEELRQRKADRFTANIGAALVIAFAVIVALCAWFQIPVQL